MYRPVQHAGDVVEVPRLVFSKLTSPDASDARFRVALYVLSEGGATCEQAAKALRIEKNTVEKALVFWEGAGLLWQEAAKEPEQPPHDKRVRMTTRQTTEAGRANPRLGELLGELQRVFGGVISAQDINIFVTLYAQDAFDPGMILLAASDTVSRGATRASYVEKMLFTWRREGINDYAAADRHLRLLAARKVREKEVAALMGLKEDPFTVKEKKKISSWYEEYNYGIEMISAARTAAGEKCNDVLYLSGILKKWYAKGYTTARDVQQGDTNKNVRIQGSRQGILPQDDVLMQQEAYVSMQKTQRHTTKGRPTK